MCREFRCFRENFRCHTYVHIHMYTFMCILQCVCKYMRASKYILCVSMHHLSAVVESKKGSMTEGLKSAAIGRASVNSTNGAGFWFGLALIYDSIACFDSLHVYCCIGVLCAVHVCVCVLRASVSCRCMYVYVVCMCVCCVRVCFCV
jgi:hypothetical protein